MESEVHKRTKKMLKKDFKGYVLITCKSASKDGLMEVEMSYDGDSLLAAYLLDGAQKYLEDDVDAQAEIETLERTIPLERMQ